jgi:hypothetical protein
LAARKLIIGPRQLTPDVIFAALRLTARDIRGSAGPRATEPARFDSPIGFDFDSGFGLIDAAAALLITKGL